MQNPLVTSDSHQLKHEEAAAVDPRRLQRGSLFQGATTCAAGRAVLGYVSPQVTAHLTIEWYDKVKRNSYRGVMALGRVCCNVHAPKYPSSSEPARRGS